MLDLDYLLDLISVTQFSSKIERSIDKLLDAIDNLDFSQEYQVIYTTEIVKTQFIASKRLYKDIKRINFQDNNEIYETFEEENRIALMESI